MSYVSFSYFCAFFGSNCFRNSLTGLNTLYFVDTRTQGLYILVYGLHEAGLGCGHRSQMTCEL